MRKAGEAGKSPPGNPRPAPALRVLHVGPLPPPVGGMATVVASLGQALQPRCEVTVLNNVKTTAADRTLIEGIGAQLRLVRSLLGIVRRRRPQIVHIHTCSYFTFWRNGLDATLAKLLGCRVVLHIHGAQFHEFLEALGAGKAYLARAVLGRADRVIVLGKVWADRLAPWCAREKLALVPNGVPVPAEAAACGGKEAAHIVCVANYERRKGQEDLLRAVASLPAERAVRLTLLGAELEAGFRQHLEQLAAELGIADRTAVPGPVNPEDVARYYRDADLFCLPSYNEGLPMAMLEAMAHGLPVVATRVGAIPEAVSDGVEGRLYPAGDVTALADCLRELLDEHGPARRMGQAARARVGREYSIEAMADRVFDVYRQLLPQRGRAR